MQAAETQSSWPFAATSRVPPPRMPRKCVRCNSVAETFGEHSGNAVVVAPTFQCGSSRFVCSRDARRGGVGVAWFVCAVSRVMISCVRTTAAIAAKMATCAPFVRKDVARSNSKRFCLVRITSNSKYSNVRRVLFKRLAPRCVLSGAILAQWQHRKARAK